MFLVSHFDFSALADFYRFEFDSATSTATPDESIQMLCMVDRWLHRSGAFQVSLLTFLRYFGTETLDPEVYRFDLHSSASTLGSNDPIGSF